MSVSEKKERLTDLLNRAVRKYSGRIIARVFRVKPPTVWQWSAGERENPLTQTLEFLEWLKHRDPELFNEVAGVFLEVLNGDAYKLHRIKRFAEKLFRFYLDDYRYDLSERAELEREFREIVKGGD